ncbi:MAG: hypothetical protein ACREQ1_08495, partial [Woeseiaceae bacterium]
MRKETFQWLIPALLAVGVAAALWFFWGPGGQEPIETEQPAAPATEAPEEAEEQPQGPPEHPLETPAAAKAELRPLPSLEESDDYFKLELSGLFGEALD